MGKNLVRNAMEHLSYMLTAFLVLVEPLFCPPQEGEGKQVKPDAYRLNILDDDCVT
jgi:hypothetical protein